MGSLDWALFYRTENKKDPSAKKMFFWEHPLPAPPHDLLAKKNTNF
jgi:hypothetical protein